MRQPRLYFAAMVLTRRQVARVLFGSALVSLAALAVQAREPERFDRVVLDFLA